RCALLAGKSGILKASNTPSRKSETESVGLRIILDFTPPAGRRLKKLFMSGGFPVPGTPARTTKTFRSSTAQVNPARASRCLGGRNRKDGSGVRLNGSFWSPKNSLYIAQNRDKLRSEYQGPLQVIADPRMRSLHKYFHYARLPT